MITDEEAKIIAAISNAMPNLSDFDKGYILGIAEGKAEKREKGAESKDLW